MKSQLMPGLTVAYAQGGGYPDPRRGDMPEAVLSQSDPIIQIEFNSQNILTVGPKFGPESSKALILEDFRRVSTFKLIQDKQSWISHRLDTRLKLCSNVLPVGTRIPAATSGHVISISRSV